MCLVSKKKYNRLHEDYEDKCLMMYKLIKEIKAMHDSSPSVFTKYPHAEALRKIVMEYFDTDDLNNIHLQE